MTDFFSFYVSLLVSREANRRKNTWFFKATTDFEFSGCKKHGHSYHHYPNYAPILVHEDCPTDLINTKWVSVPHGREGDSFKLTRKNMYEDQLFICEDKRFEMDRTIETTKWTMLVL
jgi:histone deacetylase complex regulatory component SIN3